MIRALINSAISFIYTLLSYMPFGATVVRDWKHFPYYYIYIDSYIPTEQLLVYDIQPGVKYTRNNKGAILGYVDAFGNIDTTSFVAHVTLEGTIIIWGPDADPRGMFCLVIPFNTQIQNLLVNGKDVTVVPMPEASPDFASTKVYWQPTDVPNHWIHLEPRVDIDVKYNIDTDYPYVDTSYFLQNVDRYDDKKHDAVFVIGRSGHMLDTFRLDRHPQVTVAEFEAQLDKAALLISIVKHKYDAEPECFDNFRKSAVL